MAELIPLLGILFVIGIPVMSLAAHFVLRPMIRDLIQAVQGKKGEERDALEHRISRLEDALLEQSHQLDRLIEAEAFRRRLETHVAGTAAGRSYPDVDR